MTNGTKFIDPIMRFQQQPVAQPVFTQKRRRGFWSIVLCAAEFDGYVAFWFALAVASAAVALDQNEPRYLYLASTASLNIVLYRVTGKTRAELRKKVISGARRVVPWMLASAVTAGCVWLTLHLDQPDLWWITTFVALTAFGIAYIFSG